MHIKLPLLVRDRPWYPKDRPFSEFEARIDYLFRVGAGESVRPDVLAIAWNMHLPVATEMVRMFQGTGFDDVEWIEEEPPSKRRETILEILKVFKEVFEKDKIPQLTRSREKCIGARLDEGKRMKPRIGVAQFKAVFEFKKKEWHGTNMEKHLKIETLCAAKHFIGYLEEARDAYKQAHSKKPSQEEGIRLDSVVFKQQR